MNTKRFAVIFGLVALGACATSKPALESSLDPSLGQAVRHNIAAMAVAPSARQKADTYIPADPARAALARKHYREDKVEAPVPVNASGE